MSTVVTKELLEEMYDFLLDRILDKFDDIVDDDSGGGVPSFGKFLENFWAKNVCPASRSPSRMSLDLVFVGVCVDCLHN